MSRWVMLIIGLALTLLAIDAVVYIRACYAYDASIGAYWTLADRSSTIFAKADNVDKFVTALELSHLEGAHDALLFPNPENSFDANFTALKTLQSRLREIQKMDVSSFQYQTAIQQITAQEQGEAEQMLQVFWGTWLKKNHFLLWDYIGGLNVMSLLFLIWAATFFPEIFMKVRS